jgi:hypothetical protein
MSLTPEQIEENLKTVTDRLDHLDNLMSGKEELVFRCSHSGLFYPSDYISQWGRKYGIGLGKEVVSECLDTLYENQVIRPENAQTMDQVMYPVGVSRSQVDCFFVSPVVAEEKKPIIASEDPVYIKRTPILIQKQLEHPGSILKSLRGEN